MIVKAPTPFTGIRCGVRFDNGMGETDSKHLLEWFGSHGYEVAEGNKPSATTQTPLEEMSVEQLRAYAKKLGRGNRVNTMRTRERLIKCILEEE